MNFLVKFWDKSHRLHSSRPEMASLHVLTNTRVTTSNDSTQICTVASRIATIPPIRTSTRGRLNGRTLSLIALWIFFLLFLICFFPSLSSHMPYPPSTLGISAVLCSILAYTIAKMFGFGRNKFVVDGRVRIHCSFYMGSFAKYFHHLTDRCCHWWLRGNRQSYRLSARSERSKRRCSCPHGQKARKCCRGHEGL